MCDVFKGKNYLLIGLLGSILLHLLTAMNVTMIVCSIS